MIGNQKVKFYSTSIAKAINTTNWTAHGTASVSSGSATIGTNGSIETTYAGKGLKACKYKKYKIEFVFSGTFDDSFRYENLIQLEERVVYNMGEETNRDAVNIIPISDYKLKTKNGHQVLTIKTEVLDNKLVSGKCYIRNRSNYNITIYSVGVYRSKDVTGQAADPADYILPEGGMEFIDNTVDPQIGTNEYSTGLTYLVPVMTMAQWNAANKSLLNEAIIIGQ